MNGNMIVCAIHFLWGRNEASVTGEWFTVVHKKRVCVRKPCVLSVKARIFLSDPKLSLFQHSEERILYSRGILRLPGMNLRFSSFAELVPPSGFRIPKCTSDAHAAAFFSC